MGVVRSDGLQLGSCRAEGDQLGCALDEVHHGDSQVGAGVGESCLSSTGQNPGQPGNDGRRQHQGHRQDQPGGREHPPQHRHGRRPGQQGREERWQDPDDQLLQRVDVLDDRGQQVTIPELGQPGRRQLLEVPVDPHPDVGEEPERRIVTGEAFAVAEEASGEPEELDADDGHSERGFARMLGGP